MSVHGFLMTMVTYNIELGHFRMLNILSVDTVYMFINCLYIYFLYI